MKKHYLLIDNATDTIIGHYDAPVKESGRRSVEVSKQPILGDPLPAQIKYMVGGTLTEEFSYSAPAEIPEDPVIKAMREINADSILDPKLKTVVEYLQRGR